MKYIISVTQEDIRSGAPLCGHACPIALAAGRVIEDEIRVGREYMSRRGNSVLMPIQARKFVSDYDRGKKVEPFEFEIDLTTRE